MEELQGCGGLPLEGLPVEVAQHVLAFLEPLDLLHASQVCAGWHQLAADEWVWERVHHHTFGGPLVTATPKKAKTKKKTNSTHSSQDEDEDERKEVEAAARRRAKEYEARSKTWRGACLIAARHVETRNDHPAALARWACGCGHHRLLARLLGDHHREATAHELDALLATATTVGHEAVVEVLLRHGGANPNFPGSAGQTIVHKAANLGRLAIIELFLSYGHIAEPNRVLVELKRRQGKGASRGSLAHQAAAQGHLRLMEILLTSAAASAPADRRDAARALLSATDSRGWAPLHHAIQNGHIEMVELLLRHGADVDQLLVSGTQRETPIALAITAAHTAHTAHTHYVDIVRALLRHHARLESIAGNPEAVGAMHAACAVGALDEVVDLLLAAGADINARLSGDGRTPLLVALRSAHCRLRTVERLVDECGADLRAADLRGNNAWHYVCVGRPSAEKVAVVEWLRGRGVPLSPAGSSAQQSGAMLFALLNSLVHHYPHENADAARMLATMWRLLGPGLDARQRLRACLEAARCHHTLLAQLFVVATADDGAAPDAVVGIDRATATRVLARIVSRGYMNGYEWRDPFALNNVAFLVREGGADVNARLPSRQFTDNPNDDDDEDDNDDDDDARDVQPICFGVTWFDFKMLHRLQELGAELRARNAMGDTLLAHYLRPTTTACPATTVPSHDPVTDWRTMALFVSWLAHLVKRRGVEASLAGIYLDLDRPEYHRWPAWAKTLVREWVTRPDRNEFEWDAYDTNAWPRHALMLACRTNEPLW
ncbi:Ankyrin repeatcontaining protein [Acanthamoeba castellanii str. Neff]|uniref:Ankyrin repeatcontaining protein n=1 Tax=Acanthamoeba castellanii (strain ATCC 30010 / Neff) TaxID=1257118 RepID=L8H0Z1_ACACF|nr:Ankyrin repeatcontaining protein [Acanthamoeba castellanii str. Neff]ELR19139.1 Ankyrin repeatcontaining protein [Acanthamoeba castellanii str. Neff]